MRKRLLGLLNLTENELALFLWTAALLFFVRSSGIVLNNFAETVFLQRFGVEFLPYVNMGNAAATFLLMGWMSGLLGRFSAAQLLEKMFFFCGISVVFLRLLIPLGLTFVYPVFFILKAQYEVLLALLFWNLANDLFDTRQSKRIFPLVTAGGVVGQILGSFLTPAAARLLSLDNLVYFYLAIVVAGALTTLAMRRKHPSSAFIGEKKESNDKISILDEVRNIIPIIKESHLLKILIALTFIPNVLIPILNYQFNFVVADRFASESGMLDFLSNFRGYLNIVSLLILLFVGKLYGRFGLPIALMFHPINYLLIFASLLLRFDIITASYARLTANIVRTTINAPALAVVTGMFPERYRNQVRPFLRGTVVRVGIVGSSAVILASAPLFHPRYLSLVALPFCLTWIAACVSLKRNYAALLLGIVRDGTLELNSMEEDRVAEYFQDSRVKDTLAQNLAQASEDTKVWHADLLRRVDAARASILIAAVLKREDSEQTCTRLIHLLDSDPDGSVVEKLKTLVDLSRTRQTRALLTALRRFDPASSREVCAHIETLEPPLSIRAHTVADLYATDPQAYGRTVDAWLHSSQRRERAAGAVAAGLIGADYGDTLRGMLDREQDPRVTAKLLQALQQIGMSGLKPLAERFLDHPSPAVRFFALQGYGVGGRSDLRKVVYMFADPSSRVAERARQKVKSAPNLDAQDLFALLDLPHKKVRKGILALLKSINVGEIEVIRFGMKQARTAYQRLAEANALDQLPDSLERNLLQRHLLTLKDEAAETLIRVLQSQNREVGMRTLARGLFTGDERRKANSVEAISQLLAKPLREVLVPILDSTDNDAKLAAGRRHFSLKYYRQETDALVSTLSVSEDCVTSALAYFLSMKEHIPIDLSAAVDLERFESEPICKIAHFLYQSGAGPNTATESAMKNALGLPEKIFLLQNVYVFQGMSVGDLAAVAAVGEEVALQAGQRVFAEGEFADKMFMVATGAVSLTKQVENGEAVEVRNLGKGDHFGEIALFNDDPRLVTATASTDTHLLVLHKDELTELIREFPQIGLHICRAFSKQLRQVLNLVAERHGPRGLSDLISKAGALCGSPSTGDLS
ncbi:MAG: Npt1/Npt2 family nucleotide transporter [Deferrisomatales bacterium]|nr:Npt1/Npt2 family nucleotide transporter [Deferrisomatales bacterium]